MLLILLRPSQAVRRPGTDLLLVLLYCRGCWFCCIAVVVSSCPTTTPSGYCWYCFTAGTSILRWPSQAVRRPGTAVLLYCWYCRGSWYFFTAVVVSRCPTTTPSGYCFTAVVVSSCPTTTPSGYCFTARVALLLWPSQAVRRPGTAVRVSPKRKQLHLPKSGEVNRPSPRMPKNIVVLPEKIKSSNLPGSAGRVGRQATEIAGIQHGPVGLPRGDLAAASHCVFPFRYHQEPILCCRDRRSPVRGLSELPLVSVP